MTGAVCETVRLEGLALLVKAGGQIARLGLAKQEASPFGVSRFVLNPYEVI